MRTTVLAVLFASVFLATSIAPAAADEAAGASPSGRGWYGGPILLADAAAFAAVVVGSHVRGQGAVAGLGLASFVLTPAVVHVTHGHRGRGLGSAGLRLALPLFAAFAGAGVGSGDCHQDDDSCTVSGFATGLLVGMGAAAIIDQALAFDRPPPTAKPRALVVGPTLAVGRAGGSVGVAGFF